MKTITAILIVSIYGCTTNHKATQTNASGKQEVVPQYIPGPHVVIYKTNANYNNLVPVELSEDKSKIVSYPSPSDLKSENGYQTPMQLNKNYLLDNRGIWKNVAFLKITYEEYSKFLTLPTLAELYSMIIEKNPLTELCDCGSKIAFTDVKIQINQLIDNDKLRITCKTIK